MSNIVNKEVEKSVVYGKDALNGLKEGVDIVANAVKVTLGASGQNVFVENHITGHPRITKDGVTVARSVNVTDPVVKQGARLLKKVAGQTNVEVGDGTTTSSVLAQAFLEKGVRKIDAGANPMSLKKGIDKAVEIVTKGLRENAVVVDGDYAMVKFVATVSANNDDVLGEQIAEAFRAVDYKGVVRVEPSTTGKTYLEVVKGVVLDRGFTTPFFLPFDRKNITFASPTVVVTDRVIEGISDFENKSDSTLQYLLDLDKPVLIICSDVSAQFQELVVSSQKMGKKPLPLYFIKAPGYGEQRTRLLKDLCVVLGCKMVSADEGIKMSDITEDYVGSCESVEVTADNAVFRYKDVAQNVIDVRVKELENLLLEEKSPSKREDFLERIEKLKGAAATIYVGAKSEIEAGEITDRVEDAVNAVKSALSGGVVAGGGVALLQSKIEVCDTCDELESEYFEGIQLVNEVLEAPFRTIVENAYENPDLILRKLHNKDWFLNRGYNVKTKEFGNMFDMGIIDPVKVTISALENASSIAGTILTTKCVILSNDVDVTI